MVNFRMDSALKRDMERTCKKMGLTLSSAFTLFATKVIQEQRIPFEVVAEPFYCENNMRYFKKKMKDYKDGTVDSVKQDLIDPYNGEAL